MKSKLKHILRKLLKDSNIRGTIKSLNERTLDTFYNSTIKMSNERFLFGYCWMCGNNIKFGSIIKTTNNTIMVGQTICEALDNANIDYEWNGCFTKSIKLIGVQNK